MNSSFSPGCIFPMVAIMVELNERVKEKLEMQRGGLDQGRARQQCLLGRVCIATSFVTRKGSMRKPNISVWKRANLVGKKLEKGCIMNDTHWAANENNSAT